MSAGINIQSLNTVSRDELLVDGRDREFRQLVHDLLSFSERLDEVRNRFGSFIGLTGIQYTMLITVSHLGKLTPQGVGITAIAVHLSLSGAFVTIETTKLVKLGLLDKRPNLSDRRRVLLTVTQAGDKLLKQLLPIQREVNDELFASLDQSRFEALLGIAKRLNEDAGKALALLTYLTNVSSASKHV